MSNYLSPVRFQILCSFLSLIFLGGITELLNAQTVDPLSAWAEENNVSLYTPEGSPSNLKLEALSDTTSLLKQLQSALEQSGFGVIGYRDYAFVVLPNSKLQQELGSSYFEGLAKAREAAESVAYTPVGAPGQLDVEGRAILKGQVVDSRTGEAVIGAVLSVGDGGTTTDFDGNYELKLPPGPSEITISYVGYADAVKKIALKGSGVFDVELLESAQNLDEVVVSAKAADENVSQTIAGISSLDMKQLERGATLLGEADVVRGLLLNPGVSTVGEGASGFNVRGGEVDQNLLLQDEIVLFNASHALGFFSTFNADMVQSVDLYKGGVPPEFSSRLASALKVDMRDGNRERTRWKLTAGPVTGRGTLEGPLKKGRSSYLVGLRSSYTNWLLDLINVPEVQRSSAFFIDGNARLSFRIGESDGLVLSAYGSQDDFVYDQRFGFNYSTYAGQISYNKAWQPGLTSSFSLVGSQYDSEQTSLQGPEAASLGTGISYLKAKSIFRANPNDKLGIDFGLVGLNYQVNGGELAPSGSESIVVARALEEERALELSVFGDVNYKLSEKLTAVFGVKLSNYRQLGEDVRYTYESGDPTSRVIVDSTLFGAGETVYDESNIDPRLSLRYAINKKSSIKLAYARSTQYINQIFNSDSPTPSSQYQLTTDYIPSFKAHSSSLGYFRNFKEDKWETSAEVYFRLIDRLWDYRDFALLAANPRLESEILIGEGRAYGAEVSIKRKTGQWNGWLSYTYSRTERKVPGINEEEYYPSNFDQPHNARLVVNYDLSRRVSFNGNFTYSTGRPTTAPITNYRVSNGLIVPVFSDRNAVRIPDYHRLDLAVTVGKGYDQTRKVQTKWTLSLYNVYGRKNAFSVFYTQSPDQTNVANRLALLGSIFPSLTITLSPT